MDGISRCHHLLMAPAYYIFKHFGVDQLKFVVSTFSCESFILKTAKKEGCKEQDLR
jgi:hypothetical protein